MEFSAGSPVVSERLVLDLGEAPNWRARFFVIAGAFFGALGCATFVVWLLLRPALSIPLDTAVLLSVKPKYLSAALTDAQKKLLPPVWRVAADNASAWSVVLGTYEDAGGEWRAFAIVPRWQTGGTMVRESSGMVALLADHPLPPAGKPFHYLDQTDWWNTEWTAPLTGWIDPARLLATSTFADDAAKPFLIRWNGRALATTLPFASATSADPLASSDLSVALPANAASSDLVNNIFSLIGWNDILFREIGLNPSQLSVQTDDALQPAGIVLRFPHELSADQSRALLAAFGWTGVSVAKLPDGTLMREQKLISAADPSFDGPHQNPQYGTIAISGRELQIGAFGDAAKSAYAPPSACAHLIPWLYLSSRLASRAAGALLGASGPVSMPAVAIGQKNNTLEACFE